MLPAGPTKAGAALQCRAFQSWAFHRGMPSAEQRPPSARKCRSLSGVPPSTSAEREHSRSRNGSFSFADVKPPIQNCLFWSSHKAAPAAVGSSIRGRRSNPWLLRALPRNDTTGSQSRAIAFVAGYLMIGTSAAQNIMHGWELGPHVRAGVPHAVSQSEFNSQAAALASGPLGHLHQSCAALCR
jgi:hypothetical protein